jgi:hypothetical protein
VVSVSPDKVEVRSSNLTEGNTMTTATMALAELAVKGSDSQTGFAIARVDQQETVELRNRERPLNPRGSQ